MLITLIYLFPGLPVAVAAALRALLWAVAMLIALALCVAVLVALAPYLPTMMAAAFIVAGYAGLTMPRKAVRS